MSSVKKGADLGSETPALVGKVVMNDDILKGKWNQLKGKVKEEWGDLTDDDMKEIEGKKDVLAGKLQERYGLAKDDAEKKMNDWLRTQDTVESK
jgi:uncharacterized protein YjbJ (UPF0337 family)